MRASQKKIWLLLTDAMSRKNILAFDKQPGFDQALVSTTRRFQPHASMSLKNLEASKK